MAIGAAPAHAVSSSSASFTDIAFQLVDLNLQDGITPYMTFLTGSETASYVNTNVMVNDPDSGSDGGSNTKTGVRSTTTKISSQDFGATNSHAAVLGNNTTTLTGAGTHTGAINSITASGSAYSPTPGGSANYSSLAQIPQVGSLPNFLISANTVLIVTANATATTQNTVGFDGMTGATEGSFVSIAFSLTGTGATGTGSQGSSDGVNIANHWFYGANTRSDTRTVGGSFLNLTGSELHGSLTMLAFAAGDSTVMALPAPVPEPETYAMLLAGLGAIGIVSRRRRQQQ